MNATSLQSTVLAENIHPKKGQLLIKYERPETKTASGIILPVDPTDKAQKNYVGTVLAVGDGIDDPEIKEGVRVILNKGRQYDLFLDKDETGLPSHGLFSWYDVIAVVEGEGTVFCN